MAWDGMRFRVKLKIDHKRFHGGDTRIANCKSRRSGTKLHSNESSKAAASLQIPDIRTSEKQKHKVNETETENCFVNFAPFTRGVFYLLILSYSRLDVC